MPGGEIHLIETCVTISSIWYTFFFWGGVRWVLIAARGLSLVAGSGGYSSLRSAGFSAVASLVAEHKL